MRSSSLDIVSHDDQFTNTFGGESLTWDLPDTDLPDIQLGDFPNSLTVYANQHFSTGDPLASDATPWVNQEVQMMQPISSPTWSIPAVPTSNPRSLFQRPKGKAGTERTVALIRHTLKSYLLTMLHDSLPPFIHLSLVSGEFPVDPLDNCRNLVHMLSGNMKGSQRLFWRNVRIECERVFHEVCGHVLARNSL